MDLPFRQRVLAVWLQRPEGIRCAPATAAQLADFELRFGPIPVDYRWFLQECGGGVVHSEWVDDNGKLVTTHERFSVESTTPHGWRMPRVFVIGWDGSGNPLRYRRSKRQASLRGNFGGVHEMAPSFKAFLTRGLLE